MDRDTTVTLFQEQLRLSGVREGQKLVVLSQGAERLEYADACIAAAQRLGAQIYNLRLPPPPPSTGVWAAGETGLAGNAEAVEALKAADMVIDLVFMLFSKEQLAIQATGTRVLTVVEPLPLLARLMPTEQLRDRVELAESYLKKAKTMRVTSEYGTDVTYKLGMYPSVSEYGYTDQPGRWDHWPAAFVFTGASDDGVDGQIVLAPGDVVLPLNIYIREPVTYTIEKGFIQDIRGGLDADLIKSYMKTFNDPRGMGMSHVGWGLDHRAHWHNLHDPNAGIGMELRSFYGNVMFSTGPNNELGGPNDTPCHLDIPMRNCSLFLDDEPMVLEGDIAVPEMRHRA